MNSLKTIQNNSYQSYSETENLKLLFPNSKSKTKEEIIYRKNGKSIDKIIEFNLNTGSKIKTTHFDYFNDKKIRSIDEYNENGKRIRTINYVLYKSIDEYDVKTGKKIRTINFNIKDDTKISSVQEYDIETGKIVTISIYKRDGKTISITKKINPLTDKVTNIVHKDTKSMTSKSEFTRSYKDIKQFDNSKSETINKLIDNLYNNSLKFENINK